MLYWKECIFGYGYPFIFSSYMIEVRFFMITFLSRFFIKDYKDYASPQVRQSYGMLCGAVGIALNIFLFLGKWLAGMLSGSIAITADAFNNLSDAGSSVITLVGFKLSGQKPDTEHPFGHGRMEYISGLLVSVAVLIMGFELSVPPLTRSAHRSQSNAARSSSWYWQLPFW